MVLAAGMLLPTGVFAQEDAANGGGLLGFGKLFNSEGKGGLFSGDPTEEGEIGIYGIGQPEEDAPLGSGIVIMLIAGAGYVALKKKED